MRFVVCLIIIVAGFCAGYLAAQAKGKAPSANQTAQLDTKADIIAEQPSTKTEKENATPKGWSINPPAYDFGKTREGVKLSTKLELIRPDMQKIQIGRIYAPCPCVSLNAQKRIVENGEKALIDVSIHTLTISGKKEYPIYVELLEPEKMTVTGKISVEADRVPAKIMLSAESFQMGSVKGKKSAVIKLYNLTRRPVKISNVKTDIAGASATASVKIISGGETADIYLELDGEKIAKGSLKGKVTVETDLAEHAAISIPVQGTVLGN